MQQPLAAEASSVGGINTAHLGCIPRSSIPMTLRLDAKFGIPQLSSLNHQLCNPQRILRITLLICSRAR